MDEVRSYVRLDLSPVCRQGRLKDCSTSSSNPMMEGPGADSEEKHEPASDINTVVVDSLKRLTRNGRLEKRTLVGDLRVRGLEHDPEKACPRT
jgi:hypothetical protein